MWESRHESRGASNALRRLQMEQEPQSSKNTINLQNILLRNMIRHADRMDNDPKSLMLKLDAYLRKESCLTKRTRSELHQRSVAIFESCLT